MISNDGLARSNGSDAGDDFIRVYNESCRNIDNKTKTCSEWLRKHYYVVAEHADDGWVNRKEDYFHLCYPRFRAKRTLDVGDMVALGSHDYKPGVIGKFRIVEVVSAKKWLFYTNDMSDPYNYYFKEVIPYFYIKEDGSVG